LPDTRRPTDRIAHIVEAIKHRYEVIVFTGKGFRRCDLEADAVRDCKPPSLFSRRFNRFVVIVEPKKAGFWETPSPSVTWKLLYRNQYRLLGHQPRVFL
jgi:hypothetical protein